METFGIIGFVFGLSALAKVIMLENRLKESGVLKEQVKSEKKELKHTLFTSSLTY